MYSIGRTAFFVIRFSCLMCLGLPPAAVWSQGYPLKPVKLVVGYVGGGPTDLAARVLAEKLLPLWGHQILVEQRPGAGGNIGTAYVAKSAPDGYTLNLATASHVYNGALFGSLPYDPMKDFAPISMVVSYAAILMLNQSVAANNLRELVAYAKSNPGKLNFGSASSGTLSHFAAEFFRRAAGINIVIVHYNGAEPAAQALLAGDLQAMFNNPVSAIPLLKSGKVRALATTGLKRSPTAPDLPTIAESGYPGFKTDTWFAVLGPAGMPQDLIIKISRDIGTVLNMPDVRQRLETQGLEAVSSTPAQLGAIMQADHERYATIIREAKIVAN